MRYSPLTWSLIKFGLNNVHIFFLFLLPFSFLHRLYTFCCNLKLFPTPQSILKSHQKKKARVQNDVQKWRQSGTKTKMCIGRAKTHSMMLRRPEYRDTLHKIRVDDLTNILHVDVDRRVVNVEPMVTMGDLTAYLTPLGWSIPVVPELSGLTIGGLIMGGGIETSSHKYGLFPRTCVSYELVISTGEILFCSKDQNPDLFIGIPYSYGSLGILVSVEIEIIEAPRFVKLEYHPAHTLDEGIALMQKESHDFSNDFVEGFVYAKDKWIVMTGKMINSAPPEKVNEISWWYKPWFYKHAETFLTATGYGADYIPLRDYFHRHDRCFFWLFAPYSPYGNTFLYRFLFGWTLPLDSKFLKMVLPDIFFCRLHIIQDLIVPGHAMAEIVNESERVSQCYPLWVCPVNVESKNRSMVTTGSEKEEMYYDIGIYGKSPLRNFNSTKATMSMEKLILKHKGFQGLYTDSFMAEKEIREIIDLSINDKLRKKYDAEIAFPDFYSKICVKSRSYGIKK